MIIVKIVGGLGNQLFQYATARRLASVRNVPLKLDVRGFKIFHLYNYGLDRLAISGEIAQEVDFKNVGAIYTNSLALRAVKKLGIHRFGNLVIERNLNFDPKILDLPDNTYLDGYWESEKYFKDIADVLRKEFTPKEEISASSKIIKDKILSSNAVSLHVRRGTKATDPHTNSIYGVMSLDYYRDATRIVAEKIKNPHFFIFSDDPEWVKANLDLSHPHTLSEDNGSERNYEDLYLMSLCKHNIIANSTFSWWGAWLNNNPGKIVIVPRKWSNVLDVREEDHLPNDWIKI